MSFEIDDDLINEGAWPQATLAKRRPESRLGGWVAGFLVGIASAYFLDPDRGRRRRAMFVDQAGRRVREAAIWVGKKQRHVSHILEGLPHRFSHSAAYFGEAEPVDDERLVQRVRAQMGRVTRHPGSIFVTARAGRVTLTGPVMADEIEHVMKCVRMVPGVKHVVNATTSYSRGAKVPGLQGEGKPYLNG
ncbi:MAG: BON domain-containing protein [Bdellovibrionaceae bacterium]|nr:BON domain-containing protein [Pseudobdellovibrionaceae bacterium]